MKSIALLSIVFGFAVSATPVYAGQLTFLNGTIISHIPAKELPAFKTAVANTLDKTADNAESTWASTTTSEARTVNVTFKPVHTVTTQSAQSCRLLTANVRMQDKNEPWKFWFCKQNDGAWKASTAPK